MRPGPPSAAEYERCVQLSEQVAWTVDEVLGVEQELDFSLPFLPEKLAPTQGTFRSAQEALKLNHIRAHAYVNLFVFVEEYIIAVAMQHAQAEVFGSMPALRALVRFADEEVKHQQLFHRFQDAFTRRFETPCDVIDNAVEVAGTILSKSPLAIMLTTLHLELVTQSHYVSAFREAGNVVIEPHFRSLFKHHWIEEAQHAKIDMLELRKLAHDSEREAGEAAMKDYCDILHSFDGLLLRQAEMDLMSLERALGRNLPDAERASLRQTQSQAYRHAFLVEGVAHTQLLPYAQLLDADAERSLTKLAALWSR